MPLGLPSLNLSGVGLPRIGRGTAVKPRNPMLPAGQTGMSSGTAMMPQAPRTPTLFNESGPPGFNSDQDDVGSIGPTAPIGQAAQPTTNADGTPNWVAILAPLMGAGLGAAMGGKMGALQGAAAGFSGVGQGMAAASEIGRTQTQRGIENTQRQQQLDTEANRVKLADEERKATLRQQRVLQAVKSKIIPGDATPEETAQIKAAIEDDQEQKVIDEIESAKTPDALDGIKTRIQGMVADGTLSGKTGQGLIARAESNKVGLSEKLLREIGKEEFEKSARGQQLEINRLTAESAKSQRDVIEIEKKNKMLENTVMVGNLAQAQLVDPTITPEGFNELRRVYLTKVAMDMLNRRKDALGNPVLTTPEEVQKYIGILGGAKNNSDYDESKVSQAVILAKGQPLDMIRKELERDSRFTPQEKIEIAKRLGLSWAGSSATSSDKHLDNAIDNLPR